MTNSILIETTLKGKSCVTCLYMQDAVKEVLPQYGGRLAYNGIDILSEPGRKRFLELSCSLFGEEGVYKKFRLAPIPSLFIDGELYFDAIPSRDELEAAIEEKLSLPKREIIN